MITETYNQNFFPNVSIKLDRFFELSADLLCIAGYDGYFKKINPSVSKLLGYSNEELFSKPIHEFIYPEDREITAGYRENIIKGIPLLNFENRYVTKSGEIVWLSWTSMPVSSEQLVYAIAKNITHKKKLEEERNLLIANLSRINKDLEQLTHTTSHDLRSPVNNLLVIFDLLDTSKIQDEETVGFINLLKTTTEDLKNTLNNYVDILNKKNNLPAGVEELSLEDSLNVVLRSINALIKQSKTILNIDFSEVKTIRFNKAYLESIFLNLITNSIKYARPDLFPVISIYSRKINGVRQLVIADNGQGFDLEKVKNKIFKLNQKFHDHPDSKGVGLYLVHNYISSLGGRIAVKSEINKGTRFIISFKD